jgi:hypothetical protein
MSQNVPQDVQVVPQVVVPVAVAVADHSMPTPLTGIVKSLCASLKEMRKGKGLLLPVKKINNISVEVSIAKERKSIYILNFRPTDFNVEEDSLYETIYDRPSNDATRELGEDDFILHIVKHTLATLKTVKIDKLNGKFVTAPPSPQCVKLDAMWADFCQEFKDDENMVLSLNECCVCFSVTKTTTNCGHAVCLDCISKLQPEAIADEMRNNINCPMCRQRIMALN